jgi:CheY-like chemotaxis protein
MRVLVVDDNESSREILQGLLESMTFEVSVAASGEEGIAEIERAAKDRPFELVIMDWKMPGMDGIAASRQIRNSTSKIRNVRIIMVTAYGREEVMGMADRAGLDGFLIKPLTQSMLFDAVMQAFGKDADRESRVDAGKCPDVRALEAIRGSWILLVEDNEINQEVAREILESAGLEVTIANNGQEGVDMVIQKTKEPEKVPFDVILMDIQMPVMDGHTATRKIRNLKLETRNSEGQVSSIQHPASSIPIIAMTAHAMSGDREKSLEAGMDDHVTKPIDPDELFSALVRWIKPGARDFRADEAKATEPSPSKVVEKKPEEETLPDLPGIDTASGLTRVGGNLKLYKKILLKFYTDYTDAAAQIQTAIDDSDQELAQRLAHTVKGVAGNIGAIDLQEPSKNLELAAKAGEFDQAKALMDPFREALDQVLESLKAIAQPPAQEEKKVGAQTGSPEKLLEFLEKLEAHVQKKKPKPCKEIMEEMAGINWSAEDSQDIAELGRLIGKYKFKDAQPFLESMIQKLKS